MQTIQEALQFILGFMRMDLDALRPGDWLNLRDDFSCLLAGVPLMKPGFAPYVMMTMGKINPHACSDETIRVFHAHLRDWLLGDGVTLSLTLGGVNSIEQCLLFLFLLFLYSAGTSVVRCPECTTIFYRIRRQQYCSRRCTNRANVRSWRARRAAVN